VIFVQIKQFLKEGFIERVDIASFAARRKNSQNAKRNAFLFSGTADKERRYWPLFLIAF
jgi:hypothetical protein